jgi:SAM-dependent methyltransferase
MILGSMSHPERIIPQETSAGIVAVHLKRYEFARPFCAGKTVLDAACGVGYGSAYLGEVAGSVLGVDVSEEALAYAREHYRTDTVDFTLMDVLALEVPDRSFDVVCSFETIEHVDDPGAAVAEAARVLRPEGTYVVSTPRAEHTTTAPANPFHLVELSPEDFESTLRERFAEVELYGQRRPQTRRHRTMQRLDVLGLRRSLSFLHGASRIVGTPATVDLTLDDLVIDDDIAAADELVAVCRVPR